MYVLPLYSMLPTSEQMKIFQPVSDDRRLVVVATNVAETSITIPGIRYVVDAGKVKEKVWEQRTSLSYFQLSWTSKASANQRAGRAGRTGPGHCYRLYSSAVFNDFFPEFAAPEILRTPLESVVLQMQRLGIDRVLSFPFPSPPDRIQLKQAIQHLQYIGALEMIDNKASSGVRTKEDAVPRITKLGKTISYFPVAPRYAKMLVLGKQGGCMPYVVAIVAALSVQDPLLREAYLPPEEQDNEDDDANEAADEFSDKKTREKRPEGFKQSQTQRRDAQKRRQAIEAGTEIPTHIHIHTQRDTDFNGFIVLLSS
jgi:ATP-dependent RNA helicase DHX37/DHR1